MEYEKRVTLDLITSTLDEEFGIHDLGPDPAMKKFLPRVYDKIGFDWKSFFERDFGEYFNGLMIKGRSSVGRVFCAVFPMPEVLEKFLRESTEGDLLFLHHPIDLVCGSPYGEVGEGFLPIASDTLSAIKAKGLSVYSCHAPMDTHALIGTNAAIVSALGLTVKKEFLSFGRGHAGRICTFGETKMDAFLDELRQVFGVSTVDVLGPDIEKFSRIAVVAGGGDDVEAMQEAESLGAEVYLSGEIVTRHSVESFGRENTEAIEKFAAGTKMAILGVSHSASEFLVMKTQMCPYFMERLGVNATAIPQRVWWR